MIDAITSEQRNRLEGHLVVASISGGKDSAALSLWLHENDVEHVRVFADTGWESDVTYEYLRGPLTDVIGSIDEVAAERQMVELIMHKRIFPSRVRRYCTEELKAKPIAKYLEALEDEPICAVGVRAEESDKRANLPEWDHSTWWDCDVWRPLIAWTEADVIAMHKRHGLPPNPLYLRGARRVGCWPCIFSRKEEIRLIADIDSPRMDRIRQLEADVTEEARRRAAEKGEELKTPRRFFHGHVRSDRTIDTPIDDVIEWSRTAHGGKQLLLLDPEPPGCVRWGMCEGHK